jgi:hypothetical protein
VRWVLAAVLAIGLFACRAGNPAFMGLDDPDAGLPTPIPADASGLIARSASPDLGRLPSRDLAAPTVAGAGGVCPNDVDLVACLRFEGNAIDESGAAVITESVDPHYQPGHDGLAMSVLPARQTRVIAGPSPSLVVQTVTLEAQINARRLPGPGDRAAIVDDPIQFSLFIYDGGGVRCSAGGRDLVVPGVIQPGIWTSLACTADGKMSTLWVNGKARSSIAAGAVPRQPTATFWVGENEPTGSGQTPDRFDGLIDNIRLWRRVRSGAEICRDAPLCAP